MGTGTELQAKELSGGDREGLHIFDLGEVVSYLFVLIQY